MRLRCFIGIVISYVLATYLYGLISILVGIILGFRLESMRFFVFHIVREGDKFITKYDKPIATCNVEMKMSVYSQKKDKAYTYISTMAMVIISMIVIFLLWSNGAWINARFEGFLLGICVGLGAYVLLIVIVAINVDTSRLKKKVILCLGQLKEGASYESLDLPLEEIRRPEGLSSERDLQNLFRCALLQLCNAKAFAMNDFTAIKEIVKLEKEYFPEKFTKAYLGSCGDIVFFHSYIEKNKDEARKYYSVAADEFEKDMDVNGRRILAYYQYYIQERVELALETLEQAKDELVHADREKFFDASLKMEKQLIDKLYLEIINGKDETKLVEI